MYPKVSAGLLVKAITKLADKVGNGSAAQALNVPTLFIEDCSLIRRHVDSAMLENPDLAFDDLHALARMRRKGIQVKL